MNSKQIAELAGVSRSTVSRVVNNYSNVPEETKQKVNKIIKEHGYIPNISAQNLAGKANKIVGVFLYDVPENPKKQNDIGIDSLYYKEFITKLIAANEMSDFMTLVEIITKNKDFNRIENLFQNNIICGGIFIGFQQYEKWLIEFCKKNYKTVCIDIFRDNMELGRNTYLLNTQNYSSSYNIVSGLIDKGFRKIIHLSGNKKRMSLEDRECGYIDALKDNGLPKREDFIVQCYDAKEIAYQAIKEKIESGVKFDAIFGANDLLCVGALKALKEYDMENEIHMHGFDNFESKFYNFSSAMINQNEAGIKAVEILTTDKIRERIIKLDVELKERV